MLALWGDPEKGEGHPWIGGHSGVLGSPARGAVGPSDKGGPWPYLERSERQSGPGDESEQGTEEWRKLAGDPSHRELGGQRRAPRYPVLGHA
ncbi:hypothetical protein NDU88_010621 [Pleurodeles waltl]|uniref:Uncharacterized protein n=1 Tax=Pleurodeles waltl TaxID=8319 RepID=A0AAV7PZ99_PLEWA|nr:hypothetical protein NDU88_010621 [Pleurodeles waltl]